MSDATTPAPDKNQLIEEAKAVLSGQSLDPPDIFVLAKRLKKIDEFGYARKFLDRARKMQDAEWTPEERLELTQSLVTAATVEIVVSSSLDSTVFSSPPSTLAAAAG